MVEKQGPTTVERIEEVIIEVRGQKVIIDHDLARLYGITTKRLNEHVKRHIERFPKDFMFKITKEEKEYVVANCDHLVNLRYSPVLPYVFTEHGAVMLASILNNVTAIQVSIEAHRLLAKV